MTAMRTVKSESYPINRRDVLKSAAVVGAVSMFGVPTALARPAGATSHTVETLYLSSSEPVSGGQQTRLFTVALDSTSMQADLTELYVTTDPDFQRVDAIAASLDGTIVYLVDRDSSHLGSYDVGADTFTDHGAISGLPGLTVLAAFSPTGELYVASNSTNKLYTVDFSGSPVATEVVTISGATVNGADIAFDADEVLYLHSNSNDTLYTVDYDSSSATFGQATAVGSDTNVSLTGLAVRDSGNGALVGSSRTKDAVVVFDKSTGVAGDEYAMHIGATPYDYLNGDMSVGALDVDVCIECAFDGTYKFEYVYDEETQVDGFVLEGTGFDDIVFASYVSKTGEDHEPISVTFDSDICADSLVATVKAGQVVETVDVTSSGDGTFTVSIEGNDAFVNEKNGQPFAISNVVFECVDDAQQ